MIHKNRQGSESRLSSWRTAAAWEAFCWEFKKVAGIPNLRLSVIIWSWMSESKGDTTTVTPGWRVAGSCKHKIKLTGSKAYYKIIDNYCFTNTVWYKEKLWTRQSFETIYNFSIF